MNQHQLNYAQAEDLIAAERKRQKEVIGYTDEDDDRHTRGELRVAAECYFIAALTEKGAELTADGNINPTSRVPKTWPWSPGSWRPFSGKVRMLSKAGALYTAELERLKRKDRNDAHHLMLQEIVEERIKEVTAELGALLAPPRVQQQQDHGRTFNNLADFNRDGGDHVRMRLLDRRWEGPQEGSSGRAIPSDDKSGSDGE